MEKCLKLHRKGKNWTRCGRSTAFSVIQRLLPPSISIHVCRNWMRLTKRREEKRREEKRREEKRREEKRREEKRREEKRREEKRVDFAAQFDLTRESSPGSDTVRVVSLMIPRVVLRGRSQLVESFVWLVPPVSIDRLISLS